MPVTPPSELLYSASEPYAEIMSTTYPVTGSSWSLGDLELKILRGCFDPNFRQVGPPATTRGGTRQPGFTRTQVQCDLGLDSSEERSGEMSFDCAFSELLLTPGRHSWGPAAGLRSYSTESYAQTLYLPAVGN
jgi:hypothetical protein